MHPLSLQLVRGFHQLWSFLSYTLLYLQLDSELLRECCQQAVERLISLGYIRLEEGASPEHSTYSVTTLGRATYKGQESVLIHVFALSSSPSLLLQMLYCLFPNNEFSCLVLFDWSGCLPVTLAHVVLGDLVQASHSLLLTSDLHLLYLTTPPDLGVIEYVKPNWMVYFEIVRSSGSLYSPPPPPPPLSPLCTHVYSVRNESSVYCMGDTECSKSLCILGWPFFVN